MTAIDIMNNPYYRQGYEEGYNKGFREGYNKMFEVVKEELMLAHLSRPVQIFIDKDTQIIPVRKEG